MTVPMMPNGFRDLANLDMEAVNENLQAGAHDVANNLAMRFTYSKAIVDLSGLVDTDAAVKRQIPIRRPGGSNAIEIIGVELVINGTAGVTWTLSSTTDASWPVLAVTTVGGTNEDYKASSVPTTVGSAASDAVFQLDASTAAGNTITSGYLVVHFRCDRGNQGSSVAGYFPTPVTSLSSTAGNILDAELAALAVVVGRDGSANRDLRIECFVARNLAAGASVSWHLPGGARTKMTAVCYVAAQAVGANNKGVFTVDAQSANVPGAGATAVAEALLGLSGSAGSDPTNPAGDTVVTITSNAGGATIGLALMWVIWS